MKRNELVCAVLITALLFALEFNCQIATAQLSTVWVQQVNVPMRTVAFDLAADSLGNVYTYGRTDGQIGPTHVGGEDAYLIKYDRNGNKLWAQQFGTTQNDEGDGVAVDGQGNVITVGNTGGSFAGPLSGETDAFVRKYDSAGNVLWSRQFGSSTSDVANGAAADAAGNVFVTGYVHYSLGNPSIKPDVFLRKYTSDGTFAWETLLSSSADDEGGKVGTDGQGNVYVCGHTLGTLDALGNGQAFVSKFAPDGSPVWTHQFGSTGQDLAYDIAVDAAGNSYVGGSINKLGFLKKYDSAGNNVWTQFLTNFSVNPSTVFSVSLDGSRGVYISGSLTFSPFVAEYSPDGVLLQSSLATVLGHPYDARSVADGFGSVYGFNTVDFGGIGLTLGTVLAKLSPVPEPASALLFGMGSMLVVFFSRRQRV
jgi:hypothetical protein